MRGLVQGQHLDGGKAQDAQDLGAGAAGHQRHQCGVGAVGAAQHLKRKAAGAGAVRGRKTLGQGGGLVQRGTVIDRRQQGQRALARRIPDRCAGGLAGFPARDLSNARPLPRLPASSAMQGKPP